MSLIEVFGRRNSANVQKVMWAIGELGLEYRRRDVGGSFGFPDEYLQLNPNGLVPALRDGDLSLWESNACVRYLSRTYGAGTLWPEEPGALAHADQWMDWQRSEFPHFFQVFFNTIRLPASEANTEQIHSGIEQCARTYTLLDRHLASREYLAGDTFTMGDIPIGTITYRYLALDIERPAMGHVQDGYRRLSERSAYRKHVMIPFGRNASEWVEEERKSAGVQ